METNSSSTQKLIDQSLKGKQSLANYDPYAASPNRERTLDNVTLGCEPLITGPIRL